MFYISSQGHSASAWLARSLNLHPNIICWHGLRSIPPYPPGTCASLNPAKFIDALEICEKNAFEIKQFGVSSWFRVGYFCQWSLCQITTCHLTNLHTISHGGKQYCFSLVFQQFYPVNGISY